MKSTLIWLLCSGALLLFSSTVDAWNRQLFNRYSRNLYRNVGGSGSGFGVGVGVGVGVGDMNAADNNEFDEFSALFGIGNDVGRAVGNVGGGSGSHGANMQQPEVYGIVEPLIEDMPCVDRPCNVNDDCCPTGVCVNTYGQGKCIYVYGRKRDQCQRNLDCEPGMSCLKDATIGAMTCQTALNIFTSSGNGGAGNSGASMGNLATTALELKQFGESCMSSSDCNVAKGMCCQLQRNHHRVLPRKLCAYFRDPFMCIDIMPNVDNEDSHLMTAFSQRRM